MIVFSIKRLKRRRVFLTELHPHVELHAQSLVDIRLGDCAVTKRVLRILCRQTTQEFEFCCEYYVML